MFVSVLVSLIPKFTDHINWRQPLKTLRVQCFFSRGTFSCPWQTSLHNLPRAFFGGARALFSNLPRAILPWHGHFEQFLNCHVHFFALPRVLFSKLPRAPKFATGKKKHCSKVIPPISSKILEPIQNLEKLQCMYISIIYLVSYILEFAKN